MKTILVDAVYTLIVENENGVFEVFRDMYKLLEEHPNRKIILTNADTEKMEVYGLFSAPYDVFTLKHDPEKTDPEYYKIMLDHFDLDVEDVVYFEHNKEAVESAQSVGISTHYYDPRQRDLEALEDFLGNNL